MDRLVTIAKYQWRSYWRQLARGNRLSAGNQALAGIIACLVLLKYVQFLRTASKQLASGRTSQLETLLLAIGLAWIFYFSGRERNSEGPRRLRHLPLSLKELFAIRAISVMMPPYAWLLLAASIAIFYPISHAPHPRIGMIAALLFIGASWLTGITIAHLLSMWWWRRVLAVAALLLAIGSGTVFAVTGKPPQLWPLTDLMPTQLVASITVAEHWSIVSVKLGILCLLVVGSLLLAILSFRGSLDQSSANGSIRGSIWQLSLPGRFGGLIGKDLRYFRRLLDIYLGLLVMGAGCFYMATVDVASRDIYLVFLTFIFLPNSPLAFNCFGLDTWAGLDRYTLLPLSGRTILLSKNIAFLCFVGLQAAPLLVLAMVRLGLADGLGEWLRSSRWRALTSRGAIGCR